SVVTAPAPAEIDTISLHDALPISGVPAGHESIGLITLNFAANGLGLDNAATPIGLRAMHSLQTLNPEPRTATNAQILFLVLNASDRKSTRLNSSHVKISYAVFCLK